MYSICTINSAATRGMFSLFACVYLYSHFIIVMQLATMHVNNVCMKYYKSI